MLTPSCQWQALLQWARGVSKICIIMDCPVVPLPLIVPMFARPLRMRGWPLEALRCAVLNPHAIPWASLLSIALPSLALRAARILSWSGGRAFRVKRSAAILRRGLIADVLRRSRRFRLLLWHWI